jgi:hypothetical protein
MNHGFLKWRHGFFFEDKDLIKWKKKETEKELSLEMEDISIEADEKKI